MVALYEHDSYEMPWSHCKSTAVKLEKQDEGHQQELGRLREDGAELEREHAQEREEQELELKCGVYLDRNKDTAPGSGHQACAECASELTDCHIFIFCSKPIISRTRHL
jgi:hypothetical protein